MSYSIQIPYTIGNVVKLIIFGGGNGGQGAHGRSLATCWKYAAIVSAAHGLHSKGVQVRLVIWGCVGLAYVLYALNI